jgi:very-long-chain (3R)-3-hydroxyacyl-CoA dehydratase
MAPQRNPQAPSQPRLLYLTTYNLVFASLWASVFVRAISHAQKSTKSELFAATEPQARWIQTASLLEVLHAAFGTHFSCISLPIDSPQKVTSYFNE